MTCGAGSAVVCIAASALTGAEEGFVDGFMMGAATGAISGALNPSVCFVAGTAILSSAGYVVIKAIREGDYVYATDPETGESGYKRVVQTFERETDELVEVTIGDETTTTVTR